MKTKSALVCILLAVALTWSSAPCQAVVAPECTLIDDFNTELGFALTELTNWNITSGNVDVIGTLPIPPFDKTYDYFPPYGRYIDLSGSAPGTMTLKAPLALGAGWHTISFALAGSQRSEQESATYRIFGNGLEISDTITLANKTPFTSFFIPFALENDGDISLSFASADLDGDPYVGLLLDNVRVCQGVVVPIPASVLLLGSGLLGLGLLGWRRRRQ